MTAKSDAATRRVHPSTHSTLPGDVAWALLAGTVTTLAGGYIFGQGNQWVHFVQLYRWLDPEYLRGDWFVNAVEGSSPRLYYIMAIAPLLKILPIESLMLVLTVLGNAGVGLVTCRAVRHLVPAATSEPRVATALVLGVLGFGAGGAGHLARSFVEPSLLARALALTGLWCFIRGRTVAPIAWFACAIALHPLVGTETLAIGGLAGVSTWLAVDRRGSAFPWRYVGGPAVLAVWTWLLWRDTVVRTLDTAEFSFIVAEIRSPHHYLPSTFGADALLALAVFVVATTTAWTSWRRHEPKLDAALGWVMVWTAAALVAGWVFVEVWPVRLAIAAQTFRMTYLIKWVGFVLIVSNAVRWWRLAASTGRTGVTLSLRVAALVSLLTFGKLYALGALLGQWLGSAAERRSSGLLSRLAPVAVGVAVAGAMVLPINRRVGEPLVGWLLLALALLPCVMGPKLRRAAVVTVLLLLTGSLVFRNSTIVRRSATLLGTQPPVIRWADFVGDSAGIEQWARQSSPEDAVFVVPPSLGQFRFGAQRAIVVDFKAIPFADEALREWNSRMHACCVPSGFEGTPGQAAFVRGYREIDDERLRYLHDTYGARFAVLIAGMQTNLPEMYADSSYKIVELDR